MTPNKEDYLKCLYELGTRHNKITNKEIAQLMQVSPPAVTEMMKKLLAEELLIKDKKAGYLLTDLGLKLVSDLYRKHRLIEVFLTTLLKDWISCWIIPKLAPMEEPFQLRENS